MPGDRLMKIGVFYDGHYFLKVSNYYVYQHERRARLSVNGLHNFIRHQVALSTNTDVNLCHIVDAHFFRGRLPARDANSPLQLYHDRVFDDILMGEGVVTHYLPLRGSGAKKQEKGIDVWLALEALEMAFYKRFDVLVLVACDGDYLPLVRKLNTLGIGVMLLSWDFRYTNEDGEQQETRTSQDLLEEVSYPIAMHEIIDNRLKKNDPVITGLFTTKQTSVRPDFLTQEAARPDGSVEAAQPPAAEQGEILSVKNGYGFIKYPDNNVFFHYGVLTNCDISALHPGETVRFTKRRTQEGKWVAESVEKIELQ